MNRVQAEDPLVVFLEGPLGAGKTTFVQACVSVLGGVVADVTSPTFLKMVEHTIPNYGLLLHLDGYRIENSEDYEKLALETYSGARAWFVEWPGTLKEYLKAHPHLKSILGFQVAWNLSFLIDSKTGKRSFSATHSLDI